MGTEMKTMKICTPEWWPGTYGHRNGAGYIWAPEGCPGTYGHQKGAQEHLGTRMVPGLIWSPEVVPSQD